jgi:methyl-accepting chemotaxis protein
MDNLNILIAFTAVTAAAVVIQAGMLVGMYLAVRKTGAKVELLAAEVKTKVLPTADLAQSMMIDLRPKIETMVGNVSESTTLVKAQLGRVDATVNDVLDRTRLQVIRADELLSSTMDKVEETTEMVHHTVVSPIRQLAGVVQGVSVGLEYFLGAKRTRRRNKVSVPQDEMFI